VDVSAILIKEVGDTFKKLCKTSFCCDGKIIAIKGIGGYLFLCDAKNSDASTIMERKHRPHQKAFAVLYKNMKNDSKCDLNSTILEKAPEQNGEAPLFYCRPKQKFEISP